jgi:hypothetical protein
MHVWTPYDWHLMPHATDDDRNPNPVGEGGSPKAQSERPGKIVDNTTAQERFDYISERVLRWAFTDIVWATLPLTVLALMAFIFFDNVPPDGFKLVSFWTNPEWSFASITLFAACLREMLRVKMEVQKDNFASTSAVIGVVVAAIILNTALLGFIYSERMGARLNPEHVILAQKIFFAASILVTILIFWFEASVWSLQRGVLRLRLLEERLQVLTQQQGNGAGLEPRASGPEPEREPAGSGYRSGRGG